MNFNFSFQIFAWVACCLLALESLAAKIISKHKINNPWLFNIVWVFFVVVLNSAICLWGGIGLPKIWNNIIWAGLFFALSSGLFTLVVYKFDVSVFVPLENLRTVFAVLLGMLFLGEVLTKTQLWLICVMVFAGIFVTADEKFSFRSFFNKKTFLILAEMASLAFMAMFLKKAAAENNFWTLNFWYNLIGMLFLLFTWPLFSKDIKKIDKTHIGGIFVLALFGAVGTLAATRAYASNIGISGAIISIPLSVIVVMLIAPFYPKLLEHHTVKVYIIRIAAAIILVYAGIKLI